MHTVHNLLNVQKLKDLVTQKLVVQVCFHISFLDQVMIIGVNKAKPTDTNSNNWWHNDHINSMAVDLGVIKGHP